MKKILVSFILLGALTHSCRAMEQIEESDEEKIIDLLLPLIPSEAINSQNSDGETLLFRAVLIGNKNLMRALLKRNADPRIPNNEGITPIELAKNGSPHRFIAYELKYAAQQLDAQEGLPWKDYIEIGNRNSQH